MPSFWWRDIGAPRPRAPLPGDRSFDVAIAGGGYTGLWTAYYLSGLDPALRIVVLDAQHAGFGASGRNGGWCSGYFPVPHDVLARRFGEDAAERMRRALADAVDEVGRSGIRCDFVKGGTITLARSAAQERRARRGQEPDESWLTAAQARAICGATGVRGATFGPSCAALHPAKLVRGLAAACEARGVALHDRTRVTGIHKGRMTTDRGTVTADVVVRALEGWTPQLPGARRAVVPVYSLMVVTEPLPPAAWERIGLRGRETFAEHRNMIVYGQRTADDRLAFGGRGAPYHFGSSVRPDHDRDPRLFAGLRRGLRDLFDVDVPIADEWGGPLAIPRDWMPSVGLRDGTGWAGGYSGDGVAAANLAGRTLADLITGRDTDRTTLPWVNHRSPRWEPEPVRWLGINLGLRAVALRDAWEGRRGCSCWRVGCQ